jgi:hypothetical protein
VAVSEPRQAQMSYLAPWIESNLREFFILQLSHLILSILQQAICVRIYNNLIDNILLQPKKACLNWYCFESYN